MADDFLSATDLIADALDLAPIEVTDLENQAPLMARMPMVRASAGILHKYTKETEAPVVGYRAENAGRELDKSVDAPVEITLKILDFSWAVDKATADYVEATSREQKIAREGSRHVRAAMFKAENQFISGTAADAAGHIGFAQITDVDAIADRMVISAGGTTPDTASSVWALRLGMDDVAGVYNGDMPVSLGSTVVQDFVDGSGLHYPAYYTPGCTWMAMQQGSAFSIGRIVNITEDADKGLTDDLIYDLFSQFPSGRMPNLLVASRRSMKQLRESRTATNATGAPAPWPTSVDGVPIITSEAVGNTDALVT